MNKFLEGIRNAKKYEVEFFDCKKIDVSYIKNTRKKFSMSQNVFSHALGISKKTLEKWEQGKTKLKGPDAILMYLLNEEPRLMDVIFKRSYYNEESLRKFFMKKRNSNESFQTFPYSKIDTPRSLEAFWNSKSQEDIENKNQDLPNISVNYTSA